MKVFKNIAHFLGAFKFSLQGLRTCFKAEHAFRQECALGVLHYALLIALPLAMWLRIVLGVIFPLLLSAELLNTAIEAAVDLASPGRNDLAKKAKDCGSAAVMVLIVAIAVCWGVAIVNCFGVY